MYGRNCSVNLKKPVKKYKTPELQTSLSWR